MCCKQLILFFIFNCIALCAVSQSHQYRVLIFTKTAGFRHATVTDGAIALQKLGEEHHIKVDTTSDAGFFRKKILKKYDAVIFMSTSGVVFNEKQKLAFKRYIQNGGGFMGIHAASTTEYNWPWYKNLIGAHFDKHPKVQEAELVIHQNQDFPFLKTYPSPWKRTDEWYNFRELPQNVNVLITIDEDSYEGGTNGAFHPITWYHEFDGGRSFYTALGHTKESYEEPLFLELLKNGLFYAIGK